MTPLCIIISILVFAGYLVSLYLEYIQVKTSSKDSEKKESDNPSSKEKEKLEE